MLINDSNEHSKKLRGLISKQTFFYAQHTFCIVQLPLCRFLLHNYNVTLSSYTFYGGNVVCAHKNIYCLGPSSPFFFLLPLIFNLLAASISHFLPADIKL